MLPGMIPNLGATGGSEPFGVTWTDAAVDTANRSTYTWTSRSLGDEVAGSGDRVIAIGIAMADNSYSPNLTSVTVGGITMTIWEEPFHIVSSSIQRSAICSAVVPSGTTGDIVIVWDAIANSCRFDLFRIANPSSTTPYDTAGLSGDPASGTIDVPAGGALVAMSMCINSNGDWGGAPQVPPTDTTKYTHSTSDYSEGGYGTYVTQQIGLAISRTHINTTIAAASWGP